MTSLSNRKDLAALAGLALADLTVPWLLDMAIERCCPRAGDSWLISSIVFLRVWLWLGAAGLVWHQP